MMAAECSQESVLDFLLENGGRVKNKDLVAHFKVFLSGDSTKRAALKDKFKRFVDSIAYVKQEDGEKMVCLKKKYRFPEMRGGRAHEDDGRDDDEDEDINRAVSALRVEENGRAQVMDTKDADAGIQEVCVSDIALFEKHPDHPGKLSDTEEHEPRSAVPEPPDALSAGRPEPRAAGPESEAGKASVVISRRRTSRGSQHCLLASCEDGAHDGQPEEGSTPKGSRKNFIELMMSSSPQVRRSLVHRNSQGHLSVRNSEFRSSSVDEDCALVTLDPLEHEWMMCTADGEWDSMQRLLVCEPTLISKKDFVTGFTCLHWAAKQGKHELFAMLVNFAKQQNVAVNVNARSSAGYTPLHLAAMHNHIEVMQLLVGAYDADVDLRDYSGKKASHYLRSGVAGDIKDILGACGNSDTENASGAGRWKLPKGLPSNLNPLRLLNHPEQTAADAQPKPRSLYRKPSIGRIRLQRNRFKTQIVHSTSFRENEEGDDSLKSPVKSRPISNLFG